MDRNSDRRSRRTGLALGLAVAVAAISPALASAATTLHVTTEGTDTGDCIVDACATVGYAVQQAAADDVIQVAAGTYSPTSAITVNKAVTIRGAQGGVDARDRDVPESEETVLDGANLPSGAGGVVRLVTPGATLDGVTVRNHTQAAVQMLNSASGYALRNSILTDTEVGVDMETAATSVAPTVIERNRFEANNRMTLQSGIYGDGPLDDVTIRDNLFTGHTNVPINLAGPTAANRSDVTIAANRFEDERQIVALDVDGLDVTANTFVDGRNQAIALQGGVQHLTFTANTITHPRDSGVLFSDLYGTGPNGTATISGNTITDAAGITEPDGDPGADSAAVTVTRRGADGDPGYAGALTVTGNRLVANVRGIYNGVDDVTVDASDNWWGSNGGPTVSGPNSVQGPGITSAPYLVLTGSASPSDVLIGGTATLTAALHTNSAGQEVSAAPDGTAVTFAASGGSLSTTASTLTSGSATSTFTASQAGDAGATVSVDGQTVPVGLAVTAPAPGGGGGGGGGTTPTTPTTPEPAPEPSAPSEAQSPSNSPSRPTPAQVDRARSDARRTLSGPAKVDGAFDFDGQALVFVPTSGRKRADNTPTVAGRTVTFDRGSLSRGERQNLLALSCPSVDCTGKVTISLTYRDGKGRTRTVRVPVPASDLAAGDVAAVRLKLPKAVRQQILHGKPVRLNIAIAVQSGGASLGTDRRTLTLRTAQAAAKNKTKSAKQR